MVVSVFLGQVKLSPLALAFLALLRKFHLCNKTSSPLLQCSSDNISRHLQPDDDVVGSSDMISELSDDILISIISLIPIKSAIRTSILSNRWRHLHKSLSNIHLDCRDLLGLVDGRHENINPNLMINSLDRFLRLRSGSKIHSFNLNCCLHDDSVIEKLEQCIYSVGKSGVERLLLSFCCEWCNEDHSIPYRIISEVPSLRYLKLSYCTLHPSLKTQCNSLIDITLAYVTLLPGAIECVLSNCFRLQTLTISHSECPSKKLCFRGTCLRLKTLTISFCEGIEEIEIYASNLAVFEFESTKVVNFMFDHVPRLHSFYIYIDKEENLMPYVVQKLSRDLPHLKSLNVVARCNTFQRSNEPVGIGMFRNLRRLDLLVHGKRKIDLLLLTPFLQMCPLLQYFHLQASFNKLDLLPQWNKPAVVFHSELKRMEISGFAGTENDIEFALYILKSATNLEEMRVSRCYKVYKVYGRWHHRSHLPPPWSEERCKMIQRRLQGQAISKTARLIIGDEVRIEDHSGWPVR